MFRGCFAVHMRLFVLVETYVVGEEGKIRNVRDIFNPHNIFRAMFGCNEAESPLPCVSAVAPCVLNVLHALPIFQLYG